MSPVSSLLINELCEAGLLNLGNQQLTEKGRDWLRLLEDLETKEIAEEWAADFVNSFNAISR